MSHIPYELGDLKQQAKALRAASQAQGQPITHSQSLEALAKQLGFRDWNTLAASARKTAPSPFNVGQRVAGRYLSQPFTGAILAVRQMDNTARFGLRIRFDTPVDVIRFDSMSNLRSQVNLVVNRAGQTDEKTSDGVPHLVLERTPQR